MLSGSVLSLALAAFVLWVAYIVVLSVYRLTWHPLAKYPGPFLAKITDLYPAIQAFRGVLHTDMYECHQKYGSIIRYGPNRLGFVSEKGLKDIYGFAKKVKKSKAYTPIHPRQGGSSTLSCIDKIQHGRKRRVMSQGLSDANVKLFEPTLVRLVDSFCKLLAPAGEPLNDGWSSPKSMPLLCNWFTGDVIGEFGFGKSFGMLERPENRYIVDVITGASFRNGTLVQYPWLKQFNLDKILYPKGLGNGLKFLELTRQLYEERRARGKEGSDLFAFVMDAKDPLSGESFSMENMWAESTFLLVAGSDTSAVGLSACFFYLTRYPDAYKRLADEIRSAFDSVDEIITGPKLAKCAYLNACIDEAMRMAPPVSACMWREVEAGGAVVDSEAIPAECDVGVGIYAIHRNEDIYPEPFVFSPERWIVDSNNPEEQVAMARNALSTFLQGPRSCIGRSFALAEMRLVIARTLFQYDFRKPQGPVGKIGESPKNPMELHMYSHLTNFLEGPMIEFRPVS